MSGYDTYRAGYDRRTDELALANLPKRLRVKPNFPTIAKAEGYALTDDHVLYLRKVANHDGCMVALRVPFDVARTLALSAPGAEPAEDLHLTLAYFGDAADWPPEVLARAHDALGALAQNTPPLAGTISGYGRFLNGDEDVLYLSFDSPDLPALRHAVVQVCTDAGLVLAGDHGFTPHITLAYGGPAGLRTGLWAEELEGFVPVELVFNFLSFTMGWAEVQMRLKGTTTDTGDAAPALTLPESTFSELMQPLLTFDREADVVAALGDSQDLWAWRPIVSGLPCVLVKKGGLLSLALVGYDQQPVRVDDLRTAFLRIDHDYILSGRLIAKDLAGAWVSLGDLPRVLSAAETATPVLVCDDLLALDGDLAEHSLQERYELLRALSARAGGHALIAPLFPTLTAAQGWQPSTGRHVALLGYAACLRSAGYTHGRTGDMLVLLSEVIKDVGTTAGFAGILAPQQGVFRRPLRRDSYQEGGGVPSSPSRRRTPPPPGGFTPSRGWMPERKDGEAGVSPGITFIPVRPGKRPSERPDQGGAA